MKSLDQPKWKVVENVVAAIERSLTGVQGAKVIANASIQERVSGIPRQVDVCVEIPTGPRVLRVGLEVRDTAAVLDLPDVEQLIAKLKKLDIDYGCTHFPQVRRQISAPTPERDAWHASRVLVPTIGRRPRKPHRPSRRRLDVFWAPEARRRLARA